MLETIIPSKQIKLFFLTLLLFPFPCFLTSPSFPKTHFPSPKFHFYITLLYTSLPYLAISLSLPSEQDILLKIKQQWGNQPPMDSWSSTTFPCHWPGINCTSGEYISGISLNSQDINGEIPPSICDLKNLTLLDLGNNSILSNFPAFLNNCAKLQTLVLSSNYFVGELPSDINKFPPNLQHIDLSANNFTGDIPTSLAQLKGLITLHLDSNLFNGTFPSELGNLENLKELVLAYNPFAPMKLHKEFGRLKNLKFLWMAQCNLIGEIPKDFANLTSLEHLDLADNSLVGDIPSGIFLLKNLTRLYLYQNRLTGGLPTSIDALNLVEIDISQNNMAGIIPEDFGKLQKLEVLNLFQNQLHGTIPASIGELPLTTLRLFTNWFSGPLPPKMGLNSELRSFEVSDNAFTGQLPENLCLNGNLLGVVAFNNHLNGTIPSSLSQCNSLLIFTVYNNGLSGEVPEGLWTARSMMYMQLSNNQFSGQLPEKMAWNLSRVELSNNKFSGKIPSAVTTWRNLQVFEASNNSITGTVPLELTSLSNLNSLLLDGNQLSGELPSEIISWQSLSSLDLSHNQLSGSIPSDLGSLPVLSLLDLSDNQFSGQIPFQLPAKLTWLDLSDNQFSGQIPFQLPAELTRLNISHNNFSGKIPSRMFSDVSELLVLDISNNQISGSIPSNIVGCWKLAVLQASNNLLWGNIPAELIDLSSLYSLLLDGNQLSGELPSLPLGKKTWMSLTTLNLARNNLSGKIPAALGFLPYLHYLDLSDNKLSGQVPPELAHEIQLQNLISLNLSSNSLSGKIPHPFDNKAFNLSFLHNANLCLEKQISNLCRCPSSLHSHRYLAILLVPGATIFLLILYFCLNKVNMGSQEEHSNEKCEWELKPFYKVDFPETKIMSGLTDIDVIGVGGSGKVYGIVVNDSGDKVAVKKIWNGRKLEDVLKRQFLTEVEILGKIRHANIVKLLCCVSSAHVKLLVYEFMENQSLDRWLHRKRRANEPSLLNSGTSTSSLDPNIVLDWPTRLRVAIGAAKGICYLHNDYSPPIIHRDIKSSNILLDSGFNAKIADFGLAKMAVEIEKPNTASAVAGSFGYIAPEYWRTNRVNEKTDVYSFGVVLLELTTGKEPCKGNDHLNLADWSWKHCCEGHPINNVLDEDIKESGFMVQMENVFKLGLMCTSQIPGSRPTMKQVLQLLNQWSHLQDCDNTNVV